MKMKKIAWHKGIALFMLSALWQMLDNVRKNTVNRIEFLQYTAKLK